MMDPWAFDGIPGGVGGGLLRWMGSYSLRIYDGYVIFR
jgi:hypothetical protein